MNAITGEKLKKYFKITEKAIEKAKKHIRKNDEKEASIILDMAQRYYDDARWFEKKGDYVDAFAAINYAHGWLDAGSKLGIFKVRDTKLFVVK